MSLHAANFVIALTPSFILNGHFPDGNDGTAAIPLTWTTVPDFTGKQQGTPFSIDLFVTYLTQAGGATAAIHSGSLTGGWSLASNGTLSYSGTGTGSGTIQVRATIVGQTPSDSNFFSFQSIPVIVNPDNQSPTIPTGLRVTGVTSSVIAVTCDAPSDAPAPTIPASGLKEVRFFKNGVLDGVTSITGGKSVLLAEADIGAGSARRYVGGWYTAVPPAQRNGWVNNPPAPGIAGPITTHTTGASFRHNWNELEPSPNHFVLTSMKQEYNACAALGIMYFAIIIDRTFSLVNPAPSDLASLSYTFVNPTGKTGYQMPRWNPTIVNRFAALAAAIGAQFNGLPFFGGIGTQETSTGTPPASANYTLASYKSAIQSQMVTIAGVCPNARQMWYFNNIHGGTIKDVGECAVVAQANGAIFTFPDLVLGGNILNTVYPIIQDAQTGVGSAANGTTGLAGKAPCCGCIQPAEWTNIVPANNPTGTILQRCQYGMGVAPYTSSPLRLPIIMPDWHTDATDPQTFNPDFSVTVLNAYPTIPNVFSSPPSMVPGSLAQIGVDYTVTGAGTGIGATSDQWSVGRVQCNGDFTHIVKLVNITGSNTTAAVAGLVVRETADVDSRAAYLVVTTTKVRSRYRASQGVAVTNLVDVAGQNWTIPKWLKISRSGTTFSFFYSLDGNTWVACGVATIAMVASTYAELVVASGLATTVTAHFEQCNIQSLADPTYSFTGLATATPYTLAAQTRDQASNTSALGGNITGTTS